MFLLFLFPITDLLRSVSPNRKTITPQIDQFNEINKRITAKYKIAYFDITEISRKGLDDPALVATDGLHPSGKMYTLWVDEINAGLKN
jgi:lysophospholipase L1-like esterase